MNIFENIRTAFSSLLSNKLRSFLTMLGIIIGVASVVSMVSLGQGMRIRITSDIGNLGSNVLTVVPGRTQHRPGMAFQRRGAANILTYTHYQNLRNTELPGVKDVSAEITSSKTVAYGKNNTSTNVIGTTPIYTEVQNFHPEIGRFFSQYDLENMTRVVVLGQTVAEDLFGSAVKAVGSTVRIGSVNFTVIGVMEKKTSMGRDLGDQVFVPLTTAQKRLTGSRYVQTITVLADKPEDVQMVIDRLNLFFLRRLKDPDKYSVYSSQEILNTIDRVTGTITLFLAAITGISLLVGGIGIMNIMLVSVTERTREIGLRKAIGAKPRDILLQFIIEALGLSLIGGLVGVICGMGGAQVISKLSNMITSVSWNSVLIALGISMGVGLFFGIYPARRASRLDPITALRFE